MKISGNIPGREFLFVLPTPGTGEAHQKTFQWTFLFFGALSAFCHCTFLHIISIAEKHRIVNIKMPVIFKNYGQIEALTEKIYFLSP